MQLAQPVAGLDAELLDERAPRLLVGLERLRLAAGAVEAEHQLAPQPLPQRVLVDQRLELADELGVSAAGEVGSIRSSRQARRSSSRRAISACAKRW